MNHSYRLIFNRSLQVWQAVSELARSAGKGSDTLKKPALALTLGLAAGGVLAQSVTATGDVSPSTVTTPVWNVVGNLLVGVTTTGTLDITNGGEVTSTFGYIGYNAGSTGKVSVSGAGSSWANSSQLYVGASGNGTLDITGGGKVTNIIGYIGNGSSTGKVSVSGANSTWTNSSFLVVGNAGNGTLDITGGGKVTNTLGYIGGNASSTGKVSVSGANSTWTNSSMLSVGYSGNGTLDITGGGKVTNTLGYIGNDASSTGKVSVSGADSIWTSSAELYVGSSGNGTLDITTGGKVTNTAGYIGRSIGSIGKVSVSGADSTWTNSDRLYVGNSGNGTLDITSGGKVMNTYGYIGNNAGSTGKVSVSGADSTWTNSDELYVGYAGNGTLDITSGGKVTSTFSYIGYDAVSTGKVSVSGADSIWANSSQLSVGYSGNGTLDITGGGKVTNTLGYIGGNASSTGKVSVSGANSTWTNSDNLFVGYAGNGTLDITGGGKVTNTLGYIGNNAGSTGKVSVSGANSIWTSSAELYVGYSGNGTLDITTGGKVTNTLGYIGIDASSTGKVSVSGADSIWANSSQLSVGYSGNGTLDITDGGKVTNTAGYIGRSIGSIGKVSVSDAGSTWTNSAELYVGLGGNGTLDITNGGNVSSSYTVLANNPGATGILNLTGTSSARGALETGTVQKGGGTATFNWDGGILRASGNQANFLQSFSAGGINVLSGGAYFDTQAFNVGFTTAGIFNGVGGLTKMGSGTLTIAGSNTYAGDTSVSAGTLQFGTYNQIAGQALGIGARSDVDYGKLVVTGAATFNANANIKVDVASINTLAKDNILTNVITASTLSANGFTVTDTSALFNFEAIQNTHSVDLRVVTNSTAGIVDAVKEYGHTSALGAAHILDEQLNSGVGGDMGSVVNALGQLSNNRAVARAAMQTLPVMSGTQAIKGVLSSFQTLIQNRNAGGGNASGLSSGDELSNKQAWTRGFGSRAKQDDSNGTSGFSADSWGLAFGADAQVSRDARFGLAYGYAKTSVNGNTDLSGTAQRANIDSHVIAAYGSKDIGNDRTFSYQTDIGVNNNASSRQLNFGGLNRTATADYRTYSAHVGAVLKQAIALSPATTVTPGVRADYVWLKSQSYSETSADALNLNVDSQKTDAFVLGADVHLQHRFTSASRFETNIGAGYDIINDSGNIVAAYAGAPGQSFRATGVGHSAWLLRGGLGYIHTTVSGTEIALRYDAEGRSDYLNHTASVKAKWMF